MINVQEIRRNVINVVRNYSDAQVRVRKATSNEPWGPPSTLMAEIADLTYNVVAFSEIMQIIWKRLNDHGKNWRHVYKALLLLEYLIKTGSEKVAQQCRDNHFAIQTLKDFQYSEDNKDHGLSIREKSKYLVALLKDEEKLKNERAKALKAKERFAQSSSYLGPSNETGDISRPSTSYHESLSTHADSAATNNPEIESARPHTLGEEELQLQLALAMSKEEAEQEERLRKNDDLRLKLALEESEKNAPNAAEPKSAVDELLSLNLAPTTSQYESPLSDPWGAPANNGVLLSSPPGKTKQDPWDPAAPSLPSGDGFGSNKNNFDDPWGTSNSRPTSANNDPWGVNGLTDKPTNDPWLSSTNLNSDYKHRLNDLLDMKQDSLRRTPESFLGPNSNLVNLDALVSNKQQSSTSPNNNPFAQAASTVNNPFQVNKPSQPTINQLRAQNTSSSSTPSNSYTTNSAFSSIFTTSATNSTVSPSFIQPTVNNAVVPGNWASFQTNTTTQPQPSIFPTPSSQQNNPFAM